MTAFVDTWAWQAMVDKRDGDHEIARMANNELVRKGYRFVTTNFVLDESYTLIRCRVGHTTAVEFGRRVRQLADSGVLEIVHITGEIELEAWSIFEKYADQDFSFTDCTSFVVMRQMGITEAFTADAHFVTMGFTLVL